MPSSTKESCTRICPCWWAGKMSTMRLIVCAAELVCRVAKVRWPVSAIRSADSTVSKSRTSPIRTTSGSWRRRGAQGIGEAVGVGVQLALVDDALLVAVQVLDRVLDGDDVLGALAVHFVQHRGERGRLAGPGRAGDQHQAARLLADLLHHRRQAELAEAADLVGDLPEGGGDRAALVEDVRPEARQPLDAEREVELEILFQAVLLIVRQDRVGDLLGLGRGERREIERLEHAVDANLRRGVGRDVEIRPALLDHRLQHRVQSRRHSLLRKAFATRNVRGECTRRCRPSPHRLPQRKWRQA